MATSHIFFIFNIYIINFFKLCERIVIMNVLIGATDQLTELCPPPLPLLWPCYMVIGEEEQGT